VTVTGGAISGGSLWITPPGPKSGEPRRHARGAVTISDVSWTGDELDHVDITGIDGPVTVTGCHFHQDGAPAVALGLTEIGGAITVGQCQFAGAGVGVVDCTGTATLDDLDLFITSTSSYGVSLGGSAAITVSGCTITCPGGGVGGIQTGAMDGAVTITGCSVDASQAASALVFGGTNVTCDGNELIAGLVLIADSQVQLSGNTFQGAMVIDDLETPGLLNDPVADNDGLLPGMVMTHMDWDGNGCCDYPPEWNVQDEHGNCAVCDGVPGVRWR